MKNQKKYYWFSLLFLQAIMWILLFLFGYLNISFYNKYIFLFFMSSSSSVCFWLNYAYFSKINHISKNKTVLILIISWFISLLLILPILMFGYIIIILLFGWYIFTIIYIGKKYVFISNTFPPTVN